MRHPFSASLAALGLLALTIAPRAPLRNPPDFGPPPATASIGAKAGAAAVGARGSAGPDTDAAAVLRLPHRHRRRARAVSEGPRVPPAPLEDDQSRPVRGARQDDDGESVRAGDDQRAGEPGEVRPARGHQQAPGGSARVVRGGGAKLAPKGGPSTSSTRRSTRLRSATARPHCDRRTAWPPTNRTDIRQMLDNVVVLLGRRRRIPTGRSSSSITGTRRRARRSHGVYPDLYHKYAGHDDNRDWFMFTQIETRLAVEKVHNAFKPMITHDMHQQGTTGLAHLRAAVRRSVRPQRPPDPDAGPDGRRQGMASALVAEGQDGDRAPREATTCGRRRASTWSITASRASSPRSPASSWPIRSSTRRARTFPSARRKRAGIIRRPTRAESGACARSSTTP